MASDIANLKAGLEAADLSTGFITALSPGSTSRTGNDYYGSEEEFIYARVGVLREEYKTIIDGGLVVQIDDPSIAENWDQINPEPGVEDYLGFTQIRVEALNYALRGLHTTDLEFSHIVDLVPGINAGGYSFQVAIARHGHERTIWRDEHLPEGKVLIPGVWMGTLPTRGGTLDAFTCHGHTRLLNDHLPRESGRSRHDRRNCKSAGNHRSEGDRRVQFRSDGGPGRRQ